VDLFFTSLADARGAHCAAAVLSGSGRNGSTGMKRIKECGGLALAQTPDTAEHPQMPQNAIATGLIDVVAAPGEMAALITAYQQRLAVEERRSDAAVQDDDVERVQDVLSVLRLRTGQDFSSYKTPTLMRRIRRRALVRQVDSVAEYATVLRTVPEEAAALMKDLLISVTRFFRDPEAFATLAQVVIPKLFRDKTGLDHVRVWVSACATGEEAYSLAMLLSEEASLLPDPPRLQIFGTDLDASAVTTAREGLYTAADVAELGDARLRRFFSAEPGGFRVRRELRETVLFATHNVIRDPPFSHLDLITCRNLLIYLNRSAQAQVLDTFHFAVRPGGYLWLGQSESADVKESLFMLVDKSAHLYEARTATTRLTLGYRDPVELARVPPHQSEPWFSRMPAGLVHQRLLEQYGPPSVVIADDFRVLHMSERAGRFMAVPGGEPSQNLLTLIRHELRADLRAAVVQAMKTRAPVAVGGLATALDDGVARITLLVRPVLRDGDPPRGLFLVLFEDEGRGGPSPAAASLAAATGPTDLEDENTQLRAQLRTTIEQYETQQEEAKAANEELQAMNEELRSAAEELETGKEELQSVNEELSTVNQELKVKINELAQTNNDFQNLITAAEIGTIFLDRELRIKFSTPSARAVFNLQDSDLGRPLSDITNQLLNTTLHDDVLTVLQSPAVIDREIQARDGRWYLIRVRPYRSGDPSSSGVVITFHDISARYSAEMRAREGEERLRLLIDSAIDYAILTITPDGFIDFWNSGAQRMFGYAHDEIRGKPIAVLFTPEDRAAHKPEEELARAARNGRAADQRFHLRKDGTRFYCSGVLTALLDGRGFAKIARDISGPRETPAFRGRSLRRDGEGQERARGLEWPSPDGAMAHPDAVRRIVSAQEMERGRIARDLHDSLGQILTALRLTLEGHHAGAPDKDTARALDLANALDREVDFLAWELRPSVLEELGLAAALPRFVQEWSQHYRLRAEYRSAFEPGQLSPDAEVTFYRVAQEALNNVAKHAKASRVDVMLEARDGSVVLLVEDDGIGFDAADEQAIARRFGIVGMHERARLAGATLQIESTAGEGTSIFLRCPIHAEPAP
jgi:two-component system CheB/CheR fusion protein